MSFQRARPRFQHSGSSTFQGRQAPKIKPGVISALAIATAIAASAPSTAAFAQGSESAAAEALFREARVLMREGKYEAACPKFEESQRLDPGVGTLANLALCYEKTKRLASAWAKYLEAEAEARKRGERKRASQAAKQAARLESKLHRLVIVVPQESALKDLEVSRNGVVVGKASWGSKVPVDQGDIEVRAQAPGHLPWNEIIAIGGKKRLTKVEIPRLKESPPDETDPNSNPDGDGTKPAGPAVATPPMKTGPPWYRDKVAWGLVGGGIVVAAGGGLYGFGRSDSLKQDAMDANDLEDRDKLLESSDRWQTIGFGAIGVGASVVLVGVIKLALTGDDMARPLEDAPSRETRETSILDTALGSASVLATPTNVSVGFRF